jgi:hypothetical protein
VTVSKLRLPQRSPNGPLGHSTLEKITLQPVEEMFSDSMVMAQADVLCNTGFCVLAVHQPAATREPDIGLWINFGEKCLILVKLIFARKTDLKATDTL